RRRGGLPRHGTPWRDLGPRTGEFLKQRMKSELGMLSRLDADTSGLILFARSEEVFLRSLEAQKRGFIRKFYRLAAARGESGGELPGSRPLRCPIPGIGPLLDYRAKANASSDLRGLGKGPESLSVESFFRSYGEKRARVACVSPEFRKDEKKPLSPKSYRTKISSQGRSLVGEFRETENVVDVEAEISSGFRHQIRAHMAWAGYPVAGDRLYGGIEASRLYLECHRVEIVFPGSDSLVFEIYDQEESAGDVSWR
ncbi:MAG: pseudouridine synthase, partial [Candidatus Hydrogenedentales bacterium]